LHGRHDADDMKYKQVLIIREAVTKSHSDIKQKSENEIKTWCCVK